MKLTKIALALALMAGSTAVFAAPVTQAQIEAARVAGTLQQAWISGASAPTINIYEGWVGSGAGVGCDTNTNTIFTSQAATGATGPNVKPGSIGNFMAYACTRGGVVSVLYHVVDGGSLLYVAPHTVGTKLARVKYVGTSTCATSLPYVDGSNPDNNATVFKGCQQVGTALPSTGATPASNTSNAAAVAADPLAPQLPVGGFSDVEAALFAANIGGGDVSSKGVQSPANIGQVFGVVVSTPLYRELQMAQGIFPLGTDFDTDGTGPDTGADGTFAAAVAPNITSQQYVSIAATGGAYQTDWSPIIPGSTKRMILARRVDTSGTQASSNAFFLKKPCTDAVGASFNPAKASDSNPPPVAGVFSGFEVFEGSSTGNVKTRISTAAAAGDFAIGVMSTENDWRTEASSASSGYRYVKVDGVHPEAGDSVAITFNGNPITSSNARVQATNGNYPFHMETVNFVRSNYAGVPAKTAFESVVVGQITAALSAPPATSCAVLPRGLTLNPLGGSVCTVGAQVMKGTVLGNNCSPYQLTQ
jgi:hypothetical protein